MKRYLFAFATLIVILLLPTGCAVQSSETAESSVFFAMDTVMELTVYGDKALLDDAETLVRSLEGKLSTTDAQSEIYALNQAGRGSVSADTAELLRRAIALCEDTDGALDISIYPVVRAWGFTTDEYRVPSQEELTALLEKVDYRKITISEDDEVALADGMQVDLGSVAKGYTSDRLVSMLREDGVTSALINLGGNVHALGAKPDGSPWRVAIQDPDGEDYAGVVEVEGRAVVTSGGYERCFEADGKTYHHIIDPDTGYPAESGLISVSIVGESGVTCDGLSTALFVMGLDDAARFWRERQDFDAVFLTQDGEIYITEGLEGNFAPLGKYQDVDVRVLRDD